MSALPPLADHRAAVLRALDSLGAHAGYTGVIIATIGDRAGLDAGQAWLAVNQLALGGFVTSHEGDTAIHDRRGRGLYWLTDEGRAVVSGAGGAP